MSYKLKELFGWVINTDKVKIPDSLEETSLTVVPLPYYENACETPGHYYAVGLPVNTYHPADVVVLNKRPLEEYQSKLNSILSEAQLGARFTKFVKENDAKFFVFLED